MRLFLCQNSGTLVTLSYSVIQAIGDYQNNDLIIQLNCVKNKLLLFNLLQVMGNSKSNHNDLVLREMPQKVRELHYAVMSNDRETVRLLVQQGVNVNFPWYNPSNPSIKDGSTPLICAVSLNHTEIVEVCFNIII